MTPTDDRLVFSLRFNNDLPFRRYRQVAEAAERFGFDQLWISHDLFLRSAPVLLAALSSRTERLRLGTCILNPYQASAAEIAMHAATLHEVSNGRFLLGVAAGAGDFLDWIGIEQRRPLRRMDETLQVLRRLLRGEVADLDGEELQWTRDAYLRFRPELESGQREVPIYLGANGPKMLELAGAAADGVLPLLFPPEHYHTVRPLIAEGERERPADLGGIDVAACIWLSLGSDPRAARRCLAEKVAYYGHSLSPLIFERLGLAREDFNEVFDLAARGGDLEQAARLVSDEMLEIGIAGDEEQVVDRLGALVERGVRHVSFGPPLGPDPLEAMEILARRVMPALRERVGSTD